MSLLSDDEFNKTLIKQVPTKICNTEILDKLV